VAATKKILVICGTGIATSTVVVTKIREYLARQPGVPPVTFQQGKVMDIIRGSDADVIVATTQVPASIKVPVVNAVPLLTGVGTQAVYDQLVKALTEPGSKQ